MTPKEKAEELQVYSAQLLAIIKGLENLLNKLKPN